MGVITDKRAVAREYTMKLSLFWSTGFWITLFSVLLAAPPYADAQEGRRSAAYALVVGSNQPGRGQAPLKYAGNDAAQVSGVLMEVGGFSRDGVRTILDPTATAMMLHLEELTEKLQLSKANTPLMTSPTTL